MPTTNTLTQPPPRAPRSAELPVAPGGTDRRRRQALPVLGMVAGLLAVWVALLLPRAVGNDAPHRSAVATAPAPTAGDPLAITLSARDVSVVAQVYEPGQDSGWHAHPGIHAVAVLSGALTIYDSQCHAETYGPGHPYIGGQEPHLARNETDAPVVMSVTYLNPSAPTNSTRHLDAPAGCPVR